jgi:Predicted transcriptional regulator containing an HTH domain and an uncharacterized domain shared with the mammalian protein Schlafen
VGLLRQSGERSGAQYSLAESLAAPAGQRLLHTDLPAAVVELAGAGPITNRLVRERLSVDRVEALRILNELVEAGTLVRIGERRGAHYVLSGSSTHE